MRRLLFLTALAAASAALPDARAQPAASGLPTNADVYGRLAVECLADAPIPDRLALDVPIPYLRSAIVTAWTGAGRRIDEAADAGAETGADAGTEAGADAGGRVEVRVESATVTYGRARRGRLGRRVTLGLRTRVVQGGAVVYDAPCLRRVDDTVRASDRAAIEDAAFGETTGQAPPPSRLRRAGEAVVLAGALVTGTLLLFTLRSR